MHACMLFCWKLLNQPSLNQKKAAEVFHWLLTYWIRISQVMEKPRSLFGDSQEARKGRGVQEEDSACRTKELGCLEKAGMTGTWSHSGDSASTGQMPIQAKKWEERWWFIPSSCPLVLHHASALASLGDRRQGSLGNIAPWVTMQGREGKKMYQRETGE